MFRSVYYVYCLCVNVYCTTATECQPNVYCTAATGCQPNVYCTAATGCQPKLQLKIMKIRKFCNFFYSEDRSSRFILNICVHLQEHPDLTQFQARNFKLRIFRRRQVFFLQKVKKNSNYNIFKNRAHCLLSEM
jgi:hypothetical protein